MAVKGKDNLSKPLRHIGEAEVWFPSFLTSEVDVRGRLEAPSVIPPGKKKRPPMNRTLGEPRRRSAELFGTRKIRCPYQEYNPVPSSLYLGTETNNSALSS